MAQPLYKKYGVNISDPSEGMQAGVNAQKGNLQSILGSIGDLMKNQEAGAIQKNTLNMQQYLKGKIKQDGLGAPKVDQVAIKQEFGNLINMEQIGATVKETKGQLETDALNSAFGGAQTVLKDTGDATLARDAIGEDLSSKGAHRNLIARAKQQWTDQNATSIADIKVNKLKGEQALLSKYNAQLKEFGPNSSAMAKKGLLAEVKDEDRVRVGRMLDKHAEYRLRLTKDQKRIHDSNLLQHDSVTATQDLEAQKGIGKLESEYAAYEQASTVPTNKYSQLDNATKDFATSGIGAIRKELGWFNGSDIKQFDAMFDKLTDVQGIPAYDAAAMITYVFGRVYDGGGWTGNNVDNGEIKKAKVLLNNMAIARKGKINTGNKLTRAKFDAAIAKENRAIDRNKVSKDMYRAGQSKNVGFGEQGIDTYWANRIKTKPSGGDEGEGKVTSGTDTTDTTDDSPVMAALAAGKKLQAVATGNPEIGNSELAFENRVAQGNLPPADKLDNAFWKQDDTHAAAEVSYKRIKNMSTEKQDAYILKNMVTGRMSKEVSKILKQTLNRNK